MPMTMEQQVSQLRAIMLEHHVDAWDLGFKDQLSPGDYDKGLQTYIERFGFEQAKMIVKSLDKRRHK